MSAFLASLFGLSVILGGYCGLQMGGLVGYFLFAANAALVLLVLIFAAYSAGQKHILNEAEQRMKAANEFRRETPGYDPRHDMREDTK